MTQNKIEEISKTPFFFIIGRPRSGTTMLRTMLDAHPNIIIPLEHSNLIHLQYKYAKVTLWTKDKLEDLYYEFSSNPMVTHWTINKKELKNSLLSAPTDSSFKSLINIIYSHYQSVFTKEDIQIIGDKSPLNSLYLLKLYNVSFQNAKFIFLSRDPRDNIRSINKLNSKVFSPSNAILADQWKQSVKQYFQLKKIAPQQILHIKYEDLIDDSLIELQRTCNFLSIPYRKEMLEYHKEEQNYSTDFVQRYHKKLFSPPDKTNKFLWKQNMSKKDIKKIEFHSGKCINKFSYERRYKHFHIVYKISRIPATITIVYQNLNRKLFDLLPLSWKKKIRRRKYSITREIYKLLKKSK